ncbi:MAG: ferrous iron transport protein A [Candidatus Omnitrophica bacterium]|nr:ferrous iron transport protein A [Candidatus Omnitrophota bacterium]
MKKVTLVEMKSKEKGVIIKVEGGHALEKRLSVMGLNLNRRITKLSTFAFRGPVAVRIGRSVVALGHGMASKIWIELEKD